MTIRDIPRWLSFAAILLVATTLSAQPGEDRGYVPFPIDKNAEALIKQRLQMEKQLGPFKELIKDVLANPEKYNVDPEQFKNVKMDDPALKKAVQDWAASDPSIQDAVREWLKKMPAQKEPDLKQFQQDLKRVLEPDPGAKPQTPPPIAIPKPFPAKAIEPKTDARKVAQDFMKRAERSPIGDVLTDSPAWKRAFEDLRRSVNQPTVDPNQMSEWQKRFGLSDATAWQLGEDALKRLRTMPRPNLERWEWNRRLPVVGEIATPNVSAPSLPDMAAPSMPSLSTAVSWILLLALALLIAWQLVRWALQSKPAKHSHRDQLGPWPIRPESVSTRAELIQAFDYLALWSLGLDVKCWNHHAVADRWCAESPDQASIARALASLYEAARYTDGTDELPEPQRDEARRSLVKLAEAF